MYKSLIRPLLFKLSPETVHHLIVKAIKLAYKVPGVSKLFYNIFEYKNPILETSFLGMTFSNPVGLAAGFDKDANFFNEFAGFGFSHIEIGTVTPKPQTGNPKPRSFRLPKDKALINRMGFNNMGVNQAVEKLKHRSANIVIGGNIGKNTATCNEDAVNDYEYCFKQLYSSVDYFVINVSCPNVTDLGKLQDRDSLSVILKRITDYRNQQQIRKPVLLKISPDLNSNQVDDALDISKEMGIDGFVVCNTTITRNNLVTNSELVEKIGRGGLSGKPIAERSTELIRYVSQKTGGMPIIGVGGIMCEADAIEKLNAGATLLQIYTGFIYEGPGLVKRINKAVTAHRKRTL